MVVGKYVLTIGSMVLLMCSLASAKKKEKPRYSVPEPTMMALAGAGVVGVAAAIWRKTRK